MRHKHCELIKAWADGAEIEIKSNVTGEWYSTCVPLWDERSEYRIKPEPKPDVVMYLRVTEGGQTWADREEKSFANLKATFDGETGKLKSAEVL